MQLAAELHSKTIKSIIHLKKIPARKHSPNATESSYLWKNIGLYTNNATGVTDLYAGYKPAYFRHHYYPGHATVYLLSVYQTVVVCLRVYSPIYIFDPVPFII
jgi:hypothetical protein